MHGSKFIAYFFTLLTLMHAVGANSSPQKVVPKAGGSKTGSARSAKAPARSAAKAPAKSAAARKAEAARRKKEFEEMLLAREKEAWEEEKKQNADYFREAMTDQFVAAEPDGKRYTKEEVLRLIPTARMSGYELTDFQLIRAGRDAAIVTYRVNVTGREDGKETTKKLLATTMWVHRGKEWKMTFHQKTIAP